MPLVRFAANAASLAGKDASPNIQQYMVDKLLFALFQARRRAEFCSLSRSRGVVLNLPANTLDEVRGSPLRVVNGYVQVRFLSGRREMAGFQLRTDVGASTYPCMLAIRMYGRFFLCVCVDGRLSCLGP